jgi:hypothetical protein
MKITQGFISKNWQSTVVAIIVFFISAGILLLFRDDIGGKTFFMLICLIASYYSFRNIRQEAWKRISSGILVGLGAVMLLLLIVQTVKAARSALEWDFMCFYMQGLLGVHNLNFYNPDSFTVILGKMDFQYTFSDTFRSEILNVGLLSPPISMLLFAPLASLNLETSRIILSILIFVFIIINSFLANLIFVKKERSFYSFLFIFIIIIILPGTNSTVSYNQTNFFLLFFLLLTMLNLNKPSSGIFLALSLIIKPVSGILILFFIINKNWRSLIYFIVTVFILFLITGLIWGFDNIMDFLISPPTNRLPAFLYEQDNNQSLIGILIRNLKSYGLSGSIINICYFLLTTVLIGLSMFASKKLLIMNLKISFLVFIPCMLIIYPSSLNHYMVYLIPLIIYILFVENSEKYFWVLLMPALSFTRTETFFAYLIIWLALMIISFSYLKSDSSGNKHDFNLTE